MDDNAVSFFNTSEPVEYCGVLLPEGFPVPFSKREGTTDGAVSPEDLNAGLMYVLGHDPENEHIPQYRAMLENQQGLVDHLEKAFCSLTGLTTDWTTPRYQPSLTSFDKDKVAKCAELALTLSTLSGGRNTYRVALRALMDYIENSEEYESEREDLLFKTSLRAVKDYPRDAAVLFQAGKALYFIDNADAARRVLNQYLDLCAHDFADLERPVAEVGSDPQRINDAGALAHDIDEAEEMIADIDREEQKRKMVDELQDLVAMGKSEESVKKADEIIAKFGGTATHLLLKGWALRCKGDYKEGREVLLKCIGGQYNLSPAYNELALCEWEVGDKKMAVEYAETAADLEGDSMTFWLNVVTMRLELNDIDGAYSALERAALLDGKDEDLLNMVALWEAKSKCEFPKDVLNRSGVMFKDVDKDGHTHDSDDECGDECDCGHKCDSEDKCDCGDEHCDCGHDCDCGHHSHKVGE